MVSTYTANINLEEPARGDQVGVWDTPVNNNMTLTDLVVGSIATIVLNNAPVVLAAAQFQAAAITFSSTLTGSVAITFPSTFKKSYKVRNTCTGSSAFVVTLQTTVAGGQVICCPPGESVDCINDGSNLYFHNLERIGSYWDYAGSSVPAWVDGCSPVKPYLNCVGTTFASSTYPTLAVILGSTTLPDSRGRYRAANNQTTGRITSGTSTGGVDGNTNFASGGTQTVLLSSQNLPSTALNEPSSGHRHTYSAPNNTAQGSGSGTVFALAPSTGTTGYATTGITFGTSSPVNFSSLPPTYIGGITMIRSG